MEIFMDNLFDSFDLSDVLEEFNSSNENQSDILFSNMSEEMVASQKRYEDYIKKHEYDN
jgi:hypothetical protein